MLQIHLVQREAPHRGEAGLLVAQGEGDFFAHRGQGYSGRAVVQHDLEAVGLPSLLVGEREGHEPVVDVVGGVHHAGEDAVGGGHAGGVGHVGEAGSVVVAGRSRSDCL